MNVILIILFILLVKLHFNYDNKPCSIQLDFDANCSVGDVIIQLKEIYQIPPDKQIQLSTSDNDILAYNIKLAELILLNPHKYKKLQIVNSYKIFKGNYEQSSSLAHKEVPKIEYDGTISRYSDDSKNNDGKLKHRRNHNVNLPSTYRTNNDGNNFYYENKTGDDNNNEEQHHLVNNYYSNRNNNDTITNTNNINNRSNSFNYNQAPMNNYNRPFNYKYSHINNNSDTNEDLLYNNNNNNNTIDIYPRPNTSNTFHSHWNIHNASHI